MVMLGGTAVKRGEGQGEGELSVMSNIHLYTMWDRRIPTHQAPSQAPGYKYHASECLACPNVVPCNHTDTDIASL